MKINTIMLFSLFATISISAQEVVSSQGGTYFNSAGTIDYSVGEVIINTGANGSNDFTQGFHQTNWNFLGLEDNTTDCEAIIFPNPTEDLLNIRMDIFENVTYMMYDALGKLVLQGILSSEITPIKVKQLAPGSHSITLNSPTQILKTFKLIKSN